MQSEIRLKKTFADPRVVPAFDRRGGRIRAFLVFDNKIPVVCIPDHGIGIRRAGRIATRIAAGTATERERARFSLDLRGKPRPKWLRFLGGTPVIGAWNPRTRLMEFHPSTGFASYFA